MTLRFSYHLVGVGWAEAHLTPGAQPLRLGASYSSDALGDLVRAVVVVLDGYWARVTWDAEPGENRWLLVPDPTSGTVRLQVTSCAAPGGDSAERLDVVVNARDFAVQVLAAADDLLDDYQLDGYQEWWHTHPFPSEAVDSLRQRLAEAESAFA